MSDESELEKLCNNILESSDEKTYMSHAKNFTDACRRYEKVRGELPLMFRMMESKLFAVFSGKMKPHYLDLGEHYDMHHAARSGIPPLVAKHISNDFRKTRKKTSGWGW